MAQTRISVLLGTTLLTLGTAAQAQEQNGVTALDRVVLGFGGTEKVATQTPQAVTVMTQEDFDTIQATTVGEVLNEAPGVQAIGSGRIAGESFNIRGVGSFAASDESKIIVTLDGATKFYEQYRLGSVFLDPELMKRVEVLRGPASSTLYGSGAIGGVINFETKNASDFLKDDSTNALRTKLSYGSNGSDQGLSLIYATQPTEQAELLFALNGRNADDYVDGDGTKVAGSAYDAKSALLKGRFAFANDPNQSVTASFVRLKGDWNDTEYAQTNDGGFGTVDRTINDTTLSLTYENASDNPLLDLKVQLTYADTSVHQEDSSSGCSPGFMSLFCPTDYAYKTTALTVSNTSELGGNNWEGYLTAGVQLSHQDREAKTSLGTLGFHPQGTDDRLAVFVDGEFTIGERLTLFPGIRVEKARRKSSGAPDSQDTFVSPKLAALYQINETWGVFGSIAGTERAPTIDELYSTNSRKTASLDLQPERGVSLELGFTGEFHDVFTAGDGMAFKLTAFKSRIEDEIVSGPSGGPYYLNANGTNETRGLELEAAYEAERMFAKLAASMTRGEADDGLQRKSIPADSLHFTLGGKNQQHGLRYGWKIHAYDSIEQTPDVSRMGVSPRKFDAYATHDLFVQWTGQRGWAEGVQVNLTAKNVTDRDYRNALAGTNGAGRSFDLSVAKVFHF